MTNKSPVTALVITYAPGAGVLSACVESLRKQNPRPKIIIADNYSREDPGHKVAKGFEADDCRIITFDSNYGFGGAINRSLGQIDTPYLLISNFDIVYDPGYLETMVSRLEGCGDDVVGLAGKTLFYPPNADKEWPGRGPDDIPLQTGRGTGGVIDNTGTLVNGLMLAYNRGVGQIDIGQFDKPDQPMGACFAAFLAKSSAFCNPGSVKGAVGRLDAGYFMYYEDIDWCYRANLLGYKILYEPGGVAWHHHSLTTRDKSLFFKYHLIQRNLYRTIIKNMRFRTVIRLWLLHARLHIRRARIEKDFGTVTARILLETLAWSIAGLIKRIPIQSRRKVSDTDIVNLSIGEEGHLDDVTLRPGTDWHNPLTSIERLQRLYPDDPAVKLVPVLKLLADGKGGPSEVKQALELAHEHCPAVLRLLEQIVKADAN